MALTKMSHNKFSGDDGITKEFYETFWKDLKDPLTAILICHRRVNNFFKAAIAKLIYKKDKAEVHQKLETN